MKEVFILGIFTLLILSMGFVTTLENFQEVDLRLTDDVVFSTNEVSNGYEVSSVRLRLENNGPSRIINDQVNISFIIQTTDRESNKKSIGGQISHSGYFGLSPEKAAYIYSSDADIEDLGVLYDDITYDVTFQILSNSMYNYSEINEDNNYLYGYRFYNGDFYKLIPCLSRGYICKSYDSNYSSTGGCNYDSGYERKYDYFCESSTEVCCDSKYKCGDNICDSWETEGLLYCSEDCQEPGYQIQIESQLNSTNILEENINQNFIQKILTWFKKIFFRESIL